MTTGDRINAVNDIGQASKNMLCILRRKQFGMTACAVRSLITVQISLPGGSLTNLFWQANVLNNKNVLESIPHYMCSLRPIVFRYMYLPFVFQYVHSFHVYMSYAVLNVPIMHVLACPMYVSMYYVRKTSNKCGEKTTQDST